MVDSFKRDSLHSLGVQESTVGPYYDTDRKEERGSSLPELPSVALTAEGGEPLYCMGQRALVVPHIAWSGGVKEKTGSPGVFDINYAAIVARHEINAIQKITAGVHLLVDIVKGTDTGSQANQFSITNLSDDPERGRIRSEDSSFDLVDLFSSVRHYSKTEIDSGHHRTFQMENWNNTTGNDWNGGTEGASHGFIIRTYRGIGNDYTFMDVERPNGAAPNAGNVVTESAGVDAVRLWQAARTYDDNVLLGYTLLDGSAAQAINAVINVAATRAMIFPEEPETPVDGNQHDWGMEGDAGYVMEGLVLTELGDQLPEEHTALVEQSSAALTCPQSVDLLFEWAGWDADPLLSFRYNTSLLDSSKITKGYSMKGRLSIMQRLKPLQIVHDIVAQDRDGIVYFFHPEDARVWGVPNKDFLTDGNNRGLQFSEVKEDQLASSVTLSYVKEDDDLTYEPGSMSDKLPPGLVNSEKVERIDLSTFTLNFDEARNVALRGLYRPLFQRQRVRCRLPARWHVILENDVIETTHTTATGVHTIQIACEKVDRGADLTMAIEGHIREEEGLGNLI